MSNEKLRLNYGVANQELAKLWNKRDIDLSVARNNVEIPLAGDFLQVPTVAFSDDTTVDTSASVGEAFVRFDAKDAEPYFIKAGSTVRLKDLPFGKIYLTNAAQSGATMRIYTSGLADSDPQATTNFSTDIPGSLDGENSANTINTTAAVIVAARSARKKVIIQNNDAGVDLYVGDSGITGTKGAKLIPGASIELETSAAIYGRVTTGSIATTDIGVIETF